VKKFRKAERPGLYCRVTKEGVVKAGDPVTVEKYIGETISILQMYRDHYEKSITEELIQRHLNALIDIRTRRDMEEALQKVSF
jgi:MOSC domain-containing protein YiiM